MTRIMSTPAARRAAGEQNIDLSAIKGTGITGYIQLHDVINAKQKAAPDSGKATHLARAIAMYMGINIADVPAAAGSMVKKDDVLRYKEKLGEDKIVLHSGMRKTIAARMQESLNTTSQYTMTMEADCLKLKAFLKEYSSRCFENTGVKPTFSDLFLKACAIALQKNPWVNSVFTEEHTVLKGEINIGLAVSLGEKGLIVPNIKNVHMLSLEQITMQRDDLVKKAQAGKLSPGDYKGGTFTISNLGRSPVIFFTPIINQPESGILGIGNMTDRVVPIDGGMGIRPILAISLTVDHRVIDGTVGEQFMKDFKEILENPELLEERN